MQSYAEATAETTSGGRTHPISCNGRTQSWPVPLRVLYGGSPHVGLDNALAHGAAIIGLVSTIHLGKLIAGLEGIEIDGFEDVPAQIAPVSQDLGNCAVMSQECHRQHHSTGPCTSHVAELCYYPPVELLCLITVEGQPKQNECVGKALNTKADGPVAHVAVASRLNRIVVDVNHLVQVACDSGNNGSELLKVEHAVGMIQRPHQLLGLMARVDVLLTDKPAMVWCQLPEHCKHGTSSMKLCSLSLLKDIQKYIPDEENNFMHAQTKRRCRPHTNTVVQETHLGSAIDAKLHTAVSSGDVYSTISVQRLLHLMVPRFC